MEASNIGGVSSQQIGDLIIDKWWAVVAVVIVIVIVIVIVVSNSKKPAPPPSDDEDTKKERKKKKQTLPQKLAPKEKNEPYSTHPLFFKHFKLGGAKAADITSLAVSPAAKVLVGSTDRALVIFDHVFMDGAPTQKRIAIGRESPISIVSNDTYIVVALDSSNKCYLYNISNEKMELVGETDGAHTKDISSIGIGSKFFMSCSEDTEFKVWSLSITPSPNSDIGKAALLATVNTNQMQNHMAVVSPDSKFVGVAAFTSDVRLWEVKYNKSGQFDQVHRALELKGHKRGINYLGFSKDGTHVATASKDGSWRLWRVNVRYNIGEDPVCELVVQTQHANVDRIAFNPTKAILVTTSGCTIQFWDTGSGKLVKDIPDALHPGSVLLGLAWSPDGKFLVIATKSAVVIWKSPV